MDQNVGRFDIAMQNAGGMSCGERIGHAEQQLPNLSPGSLLRCGPVPQRAAFQILHDQVLPVLPLSHIMNSENMRMIQRRCCLRFPLETSASGGVGQIAREKFDPTCRLRRVSRARNTMPIPPSPSLASIL